MAETTVAESRSALSRVERRLSLSGRNALVGLNERAAYNSFESFFRLYPPARPYIYGSHTLEIIRRLEKAVKDFEAGKSSYIIINVPYRHGKSDIASRRLGPWFLGRNPDCETLLVAYNYILATKFSYDARACFRDTSWRLWRERIAEDHAGFDDWRLHKRKGSFHVAGIDGTITGTGAHLLLMEDYIKSREEAESAHTRDKQWDAFCHNIFTRVAPRHIIVFVVTRWNVDDMCGRVIDASTPGTRWYDPKFPKFEVIKYPMRYPDGSWLFPERFSNDYYEAQWATLGEYGRNSVAQQDPRPRYGNLLRADLVEWMEPAEFDRQARKAGVKLNRGWDLASSEKERMRTDPDFTVGTRAGFKGGTIWIEDRVKGQWSATKRDKIIRETALRDGRDTRVIIESVAGYKDTYDRIKTALSGYAPVSKFVPTKDKVARGSILEAPFETGRVKAKIGPWRNDWTSNMLSFPGGAHDDDADSLVVAVHAQMSSKSWVVA